MPRWMPPLYVLTIAVGLWFSATACGGLLPDAAAEWPVGLWCWGLAAVAFARADRRDRVEMLTVLALATPMELFFSEVWFVYEYQRGFLPAFVPPGHVFLFTLGRGLARRLRRGWCLPLLLPFVPLVGLGLWTGGDTSGVWLLALVLAFVLRGPEPRLYVAMLWLSLGMELVGTGLGNWAWAPQVPWTGLTAWNPPLLVGAFYCLGSVLVNLSVARLAPPASAGSGDPVPRGPGFR